LNNKINSFLKKNENICGYAATSKSTTILNYCNIDHSKIDFVCDTTPEKIGKYTPGTHIPVVSVDHFRKELPNNTFLFAWNHKKEIFKKEKKFLKKTNWFAHIKI
jgi:methylation protein EvaC